MAKNLLAPLAWGISLFLHVLVLSVTYVYFVIHPASPKPAFYFLGQILNAHDLITQSSLGHGQSLAKSAEYVPSLEGLEPDNPPGKPLLIKPSLQGAAVRLEKKTLKQKIVDENPGTASSPTNIHVEIPEIQYKPFRLYDE